MKKNTSAIHRILFFFNVIAAVIFIPAFLAGSISPQKYWMIYFFGYFFFPLYLVNLFFFIYWILLRKKYFLLPLLLLIIGYSRSGANVALNFTDPKDIPSENTFKIMSYNVRLFDLYNWTNNLKTREKIHNLIQTEAPDILCMQEFFTEDPGKFENIHTLQKLQKASYYHFHKTLTLHTNNHWGIATFSYYPIINKGHIDFPGKTFNLAIYTDIIINENTIRVYNIH